MLSNVTRQRNQLLRTTSSSVNVPEQLRQEWRTSGTVNQAKWDFT